MTSSTSYEAPSEFPPYHTLERAAMFHNPTRKPARYVVVIASESLSRR